MSERYKKDLRPIVNQGISEVAAVNSTVSFEKDFPLEEGIWCDLVVNANVVSSNLSFPLDVGSFWVQE